MVDLAYLARLTDAFGPSGAEDDVRDLIVQRIMPFVDTLKIDGIGNLIATKGDPDSILITAHMDEVGFMITGIREDGTLRFSQVGGVDPKHLSSKRVLIGKNRIQGVIGAKPIHLNKEKTADITYRDLYIQIGAVDRAEALQFVSVGDFAVFDTKLDYSDKTECVTAKALDNRLGCYILSELICSESLSDGTFVFTVQEESGLRGAQTYLNVVKARVGIALDTTTSNDLPKVSLQKRVSSLGNGAVISFADGATVYRRNTVRALMDHLKEKQIPCQTKTKRTGGNEASAIEKIGFGAEAISISVPCRYIHASVGLARLSDVEQTLKAVRETVLYLKGGRYA